MSLEPVFLLSLASLIAGPIIYSFFSKKAGIHNFFEEFNFVLIVGLLFFHILPEIVNNGGFTSILYMISGIFILRYFDKTFKEENKHRFSNTVLVLVVLGFWLHTIFDGSMLGEPEIHGGHHPESFLSISILLHRFPVGLTIWFLFRPRYGFKFTCIILLLLEIGTAIGFLLQESFIQDLPHEILINFEAFIAGSLIHMVSDLSHAHFHFEDTHQSEYSESLLKGVGSLLGLGCLYFLIHHPQLDLEHNDELIDQNFVQTFVSLALESSPILIFSYFLSGIFHVYFPESALNWMNRRSKMTQAFRGVAIGIPFPICSCGIIPVYRSLVQKGIPAAASVSFLIATPELGVDSFLFSLSLLGTKFSLLRLACAFIVAIIVGWVIGMVIKPSTEESSKSVKIESETPKLSWNNLKVALKCGFYETFDHTAPWIFLGLSIAAFVEPLIQQEIIYNISPISEVLIFGLMGLPIYVCASGATPFVAVLIAHGVSPGAAIAFLMTGPATNATTFGIVKNTYNKEIALIFSALMITIPVTLGYLINFVFGDMPIRNIGYTSDDYSYFNWACLIFLTGVLLMSFYRQGAKHFVSEIIHPFDHHHH